MVCGSDGGRLGGGLGGGRGRGLPIQPGRDPNQWRRGELLY